jgi:hypothetical protein
MDVNRMAQAAAAVLLKQALESWSERLHNLRLKNSS